MRTPLLLSLVVVAGCATRVLPQPGVDATADEVRAYCRSQTSVQRAADLDPPGVLGPAPLPQRPRLNADTDYAACLRQRGVLP